MDNKEKERDKCTAKIRYTVLSCLFFTFHLLTCTLVFDRIADRTFFFRFSLHGSPLSFLFGQGATKPQFATANGTERSTHKTNFEPNQRINKSNNKIISP